MCPMILLENLGEALLTLKKINYNRISSLNNKGLAKIKVINIIFNNNINNNNNRIHNSFKGIKMVYQGKIGTQNKYNNNSNNNKIINRISKVRYKIL